MNWIPADSTAYNRATELFLQAVELPPAERGPFLDQACGGDGELRARVDELIANDTDDAFLADEPAIRIAARPGPSEWLAGQTVGRYRILEKIGEGGMAVVYRAQDTTLERMVALKFLSFPVATDPDSVRRFVREAKAAAAIDHPNVCPVYEINTEGERPFIAMAYLEGRTLAERLAAGPLDGEAALDIAIQACRGLAAAHAKGVVHRDIKPANLMISEAPSGQRLVRILDFGIARLAERAVETKVGVTMGTVGYMAPEQIDRSDVDARADLWALGVVLYRMAAGKLPFERATTRDVLAAIATAEPEPLPAGPGGTPLELEEIVRKALQKKLERRYQTATEFLRDLEDWRRSLETGKRAVQLHREVRLARKRRWLLWATSAMAVIALALSLVTSRRKAGGPSGRIVPERFTSYLGAEGTPAISPDRTRIAFRWNGESPNGQPDIYVQLIGSASLFRLTDTPSGESAPVWSPDGRYIAFLRLTGYGSNIVVKPALGGPERVVAHVSQGSPAYGMFDWSPTSDLLAIEDNNAIFTISLAGKNRKQLSFPKPGEADWHPRFDPAGRRVAFLHTGARTPTELLAVPVGGGNPEILAAVGIVEKDFCWNADGTGVIFVGPGTASGGPLFQIAVPGGKAKPLQLDEQDVVTLSVRGNLLACACRTFGVNIWAADTGGQPGPPVRLIASSQRDHTPQFSPDGKRIVFASDRSGSVQLWRCDADGRNLVQLTAIENRKIGTPRWSPDGRWIAFDGIIQSSNDDIYVMNSDGGDIRQVTHTTSTDILPSWSHDGAWIYYCSNAAGENNIWKIPPQGGEPVQVTHTEGWEAFESVDGKYLYYSTISGPRTIHRLDLKSGREEAIPELGDAGARRYWALAKNGIYFVDTLRDRHAIQFFDFRSRKITKVRKIGDIITYGPGGLAVSPDGRTVLYVQRDVDNQDIMLVKNYR